MSKITRNIKGIKQSAARKHLDAITLAEKTINEMIATERNITFESVSKLAKLSRTFLYNQPKLRKQIEQLRRQQHGEKNLPKKTHNKYNMKIEKLLQRNKLLEMENCQLKKQLEILYGELHVKQIYSQK
jgi:plasmid maintenance system antidote protein VapI